MSQINSYKELLIWKKGMDITEKVYLLTKNFPKEEVYGLTSQMRRCSISIPSNIAEGFGRKSNGSFAQFIKIARGSLFELETQLILASKIDIQLDEVLSAELIRDIEEESKMIHSFLKKIEG